MMDRLVDWLIKYLTIDWFTYWPCTVTVMYIDVGADRPFLETLPLSFVSNLYSLDEIFK